MTRFATPFLLSALAVSLATSASAQGPATDAWSGGGGASDTGAAVASDMAGNVAVVGTFRQTATFGTQSITDPETGCIFSSCHDAYVVKYAPDGAALWARRMGTPIHNDFAEGVAISELDGAVYVSGYFTGVSTWDGGDNPDIELTTRNNWDTFLAKYTAEGDLLWVARGGGSDQDTGRGVAVDLEGNAYWTGYFYGTATFGEGDDAVTFTSQGSSDGFVAKIRPDGTLAWAHQLAGQGGSDFYDAAVATYFNETVFVTGTFAEVATLGTVALQSRGLNDVIVAALDPDDGTVLWAEQIGGAGRDHGRGIAFGEFSAWGVFVAGWFEGQILVGSDVLTSAGQSDALLAALSYDGDLLWGRRAGGSDFDIAEDVAVADPPLIATRGDLELDPAVLLTGYVNDTANFSAPSGDVNVTAQDQDGFLAAYGVFDQEIRSVRLLGGPNRDSGRGITSTVSWGDLPPTQQGYYSLYGIVAGTFSGTADVFGETVTSAGSSDAYVGKLATCPDLFCFATADEPRPEASGLRLSVLPHPAGPDTRLAVAMDEPGDLRVDVLDVLGRVVATVSDGPRSAGEHAFARPSLAPGPYLLRATTPTGTASRTFVVSR